MNLHGASLLAQLLAGDRTAIAAHLRDPAVAPLLDTDRMPGVDADLLGAFAWICIGAGEPERAVELLDGTWSGARSPNTTILLIAAEQRARGIGDNDLSVAGRDDVVRRSMMSDIIEREQRTRSMLEGEFARLALGT